MSGEDRDGSLILRSRTVRLGTTDDDQRRLARYFASRRIHWPGLRVSRA